MVTYGAIIFEELKLNSDWRLSWDTSWTARVETFGANILEERKLTSDWRFQDLLIMMMSMMTMLSRA